MDFAEIILFGIIGMIAVMTSGGLLSIYLERRYQRRNPDWAVQLFHGTKWDNNLDVVPRHELCSPCAQAVADYKEHHARRNAARRS